MTNDFINSAKRRTGVIVGVTILVLFDRWNRTVDAHALKSMIFLVRSSIWQVNFKVFWKYVRRRDDKC
jgi:hypothetical protein